MELRPLCVMLLLTGFIHCTQTGELKAKLTLQSGGTEVFRGENVTLKCEIEGGDKWTYIWFKNEAEISTIKTSEHTFMVNDEAAFTCMGTRSVGDPQSTEKSDPVRLSVSESTKPVVIIKPDKEVFRGERVTFRCEIQRGRDTEWTYSWKRNDYTLSSRTTQEFRRDSGRKDVSGKYTCSGRRSDSQSSETSDAVTLTVSEKPKPELTSDLKGAALTGIPVTLYCTLKPQSAGWKFYWSTSTQSSETETESGHYIIRPVRVSDGGQYSCRAGRGNPVYYTHYSDALWVNVTVLSHGKAPLSVLKLLSSVVAASPYVLATIILAVKCYRARTKPDEDNRPYRVIEAEASV